MSNSTSTSNSNESEPKAPPATSGIWKFIPKGELNPKMRRFLKLTLMAIGLMCCGGILVTAVEVNINGSGQYTAITYLSYGVAALLSALIYEEFVRKRRKRYSEPPSAKSFPLDILLVSKVAIRMAKELNQMGVQPISDTMEEHLLRWISCAVGRRLEPMITVLDEKMASPHLIALSKELLARDWRMQVAALAMLTSMAVSRSERQRALWCSPETKAAIVTEAIPFLADPHPAVRSYARLLLNTDRSVLTEQHYGQALDILLTELKKDPIRDATWTIDTLMRLVTECPERIVTESYVTAMSILLKMIRTTRYARYKTQAKALYNAVLTVIAIIEDKADKTKLLQVLSSYLESNLKHIMSDTESLENCYACDNQIANAVIKRNCHDPSCGNCTCPRPLWCDECLARIFMADSSYLTAKCPMCRFKFCVDDVHPIVDEKNVDV